MAKLTLRQRQRSLPPARARRRWWLWLGWSAATTAGGAAGAVLSGVAAAVLSDGSGTSKAWIALLAMPPLMAGTQWLMVRRKLAGDDEERVGNAALRWRVAACAGCIPALSYALHDISAESALSDVLTWYAPVSLLAGFLSASTQTGAVAEAFGWPAGQRYLPLTVVAWTIAWPLWIASVTAGTVPWVVGLAWNCAPGAVIGALSGMALLAIARPPRSSVRHIAMIGPFPRGGTDVASPRSWSPEQKREREAVSSAR